jgi:glycosyltransferase involved in cell wall biosynthesis
VNKLPISVCIISGAEARRIGKCLASVAPWTSEIVVVLNSEAQDGTDAIAASFGAKIHRHPFQGFREQKNLSLSYATLPWVLALDADEEVSAALRESIARFFNGDQERFAAAGFARKVWFLGRWITHGDWYPDRVLAALSTRESGKWAGSAEHCAVEVAGSLHYRCPATLLHYSNPDISSYVSKINYFADPICDGNWPKRPAGPPRPRCFARPGDLCALIFPPGISWTVIPGFFIAASTAYSTWCGTAASSSTGNPQSLYASPPKSP